MSTPYVRETDEANTGYIQFAPVREAKSGLTGEGGTDPDTGASPISRWLSFAFDYDDFVSNPSALGYKTQCQIPRNTIVMDAVVRVDTAYEASGPAADIDVGDGNDADGWGDSLDLSSGDVIKRDADAAYVDLDSDPTSGSAGMQYYTGADTIDILWKNGTAPTAGKAILFLKVISYHEEANAEW